MEWDVVASDGRIIVANKPSGLLCVPGRGPQLQDSLLTQLQAKFAETLLVHRLDRDTSGLVLFARDAEAQRTLSRQFQERAVKKLYVALVAGQVTAGQGRITLPLTRDLAHPPRYCVDYWHGLAAVTDYRVVARSENDTRVELAPHTGRSHQLRVHMRALGHPILGDPLYAPPEVAALAERLCLHAARLELAHPDGHRVEFASSPPF